MFTLQNNHYIIRVVRTLNSYWHKRGGTKTVARKERTGRFSWLGKNTPQSITNSDLFCATCRFRIEDNTAQCKEYKTIKPNTVLLGKTCEKYKKENENG